MVLAFIACALFIGSKTIPKIVDLVSKTNQVDVVVVAILGVAFGPYVVKFGWKIGDRFKQEPAEQKEEKE